MFLYLPWFNKEYNIQEYAAVVNLTTIKKGISVKDENEILIINRISLKRLDEGGAAILQITKINHHEVNIGIRYKIPLVKKRLRVLNFSYVRLARINRADEENP